MYLIYYYRYVTQYIYCFDSVQPLVILQNYTSKINKERYWFCFRFVVFVYIYKICNFAELEFIFRGQHRCSTIQRLRLKTVSVQKLTNPLAMFALLYNDRSIGN